jgi:hypothetical protein
VVSRAGSKGGIGSTCRDRTSMLRAPAMFGGARPCARVPLVALPRPPSKSGMNCGMAANGSDDSARLLSRHNHVSVGSVRHVHVHVQPYTTFCARGMGIGFGKWVRERLGDATETMLWCEQTLQPGPQPRST